MFVYNNVLLSIASVIAGFILLCIFALRRINVTINCASYSVCRCQTIPLTLSLCWNLIWKRLFKWIKCPNYLLSFFAVYVKRFLFESFRKLFWQARTWWVFCFHTYPLTYRILFYLRTFQSNESADQPSGMTWDNRIFLMYILFCIKSVCVSRKISHSLQEP